MCYHKPEIRVSFQNASDSVQTLLLNTPPGCGSDVGQHKSIARKQQWVEPEQSLIVHMKGLDILMNLQSSTACGEGEYGIFQVVLIVKVYCEQR
jgi:hypothetical protein